MTPMGSIPPAVRVLAVALVLALVAGLTYSIERSNSRAREDAFERFEDRSEISAQLVSGSLNQNASSLAVSARQLLSGDVTRPELVKFAGASATFLPYVALFEADGTLVVAHPAGASVEATDAMRGAATSQRFDMSGIIDTPSGEVLELYVPFTTETGESRVVVNGYPKEIAGTIIVDALASVELPDGGDMYLLDDDGKLVGQRGGEQRPPAELVDAVVSERGAGRVGGDRYSVSQIEGTSLVIAVVAPERGIVADLPSAGTPRVALALLALTLFALLGLTLRAVRDARRLDVARREAAAANETKSRFLSYISHELKTPIAVIRGFSDLLDRAELEPKPREYVEHITESGRHLASLVDELLDVARIEAGKLTLHLERVDARAVIHEVLEMAAPLAAVRGITLQAPDEEAIPLVLADPMRVRQVLLNLVSNAIKYNDEGGAVRLTIDLDGSDTVRVAVVDNGPGIEAAAMGKLFDPFERLGAERGQVAGSGLGLVVSKGLVEAMDGQMHVMSEVGAGSSFGFELPVAEPVA